MEANKIIITGGATRIGAAIAKKLSGPGAEIVIHYKSSKLNAFFKVCLRKCSTALTKRFHTSIYIFPSTKIVRYDANSFAPQRTTHSVKKPLQHKHHKLLHLIIVDVEKNLEVSRPFISQEKTNLYSWKFLFPPRTWALAIYGFVQRCINHFMPMFLVAEISTEKFMF